MPVAIEEVRQTALGGVENRGTVVTMGNEDDGYPDSEQPAIIDIVGRRPIFGLFGKRPSFAQIVERIPCVSDFYPLSLDMPGTGKSVDLREGPEDENLVYSYYSEDGRRTVWIHAIPEEQVPAYLAKGAFLTEGSVRVIVNP